MKRLLCIVKRTFYEIVSFIVALLEARDAINLLILLFNQSMIVFSCHQEQSDYSSPKVALSAGMNCAFSSCESLV